MDVVRVGVVGVGQMGAFHARTLAGLGGVDVAAVADPFAPHVDAVRAELGCRGESDPMALAGADDLDGVVIASPDETHADLALAAIDAGMFVLCEKPLATTVDDARRVVAADRAAGSRRVQLGFMRQFDPAHTQLLAELAPLGAIDHVRAVHRNVNDRPRPLERIVCQSMVHDIHSVRFLTGQEITSVHAVGSGPFEGSYRYLLALCTLSSGAHATIEFDDGGFAYDVSVEVVARSGDVLTGRPLRPTVRRDGSLDVHLGADWFGWFGEAYRIQDQAWVDSIRRGRAIGPTATDGLAAQIVVDAILESLATGRAVTLA